MRKLLIALIALCLLLAGCAGGEAVNELTAVFFNVGKADAILLYNGEMAVLIDAGENGDGKDVAVAIRARGIERLDLLIITHFDKDHVGGADKVLESVPVARVIMPGYAKESKQYTQFMDALSQSPKTQVDVLSAKSETTFEFGDIALRITAAQETIWNIAERL